MNPDTDSDTLPTQSAVGTFTFQVIEPLLPTVVGAEFDSVLCASDQNSLGIIITDGQSISQNGVDSGITKRCTSI
jgi:hypothetical protein